MFWLGLGKIQEKVDFIDKAVSLMMGNLLSVSRQKKVIMKAWQYKLQKTNTHFQE